MKTVRVATTVSGRVYLINYIDFGTKSAPLADPIVHCWGEVTAYQYRRSTPAIGTMEHSTSKAFPRSALTLGERLRDRSLAIQLFAQGRAAQQA